MVQARKAQPPKTRSVRSGEMREVDYKALAQFRYQLRTFLAFSEAAAQRAGLTPQQHQALLAIKGFAGPDAASIGDVAKFLLIRHHTTVELIDRMTKLELVNRTSDPQDARRVRLKLTAKGEQKLLSLSKIHLEELRAASPALGRILRAFRIKVGQSMIAKSATRLSGKNMRKQHSRAR